MEGSKAFAKHFMARHNIPTAAYATFTAENFADAAAYIQSSPHPLVLKASGLAAGKGVLIPQSTDDALAGLRDIMLNNAFGSAGQSSHRLLSPSSIPFPGNEVVIEEFLDGPELSLLAFSDGYSIVPFPPAQDHKRIGQGDTGPNTGGMGAYAPAPVATPQILSRILNDILRPTIDGMRRDGPPFILSVFTSFTPSQVTPLSASSSQASSSPLQAPRSSSTTSASATLKQKPSSSSWTTAQISPPSSMQVTITSLSLPLSSHFIPGLRSSPS